jgi:hypothetical protein
MKPFLAALLLLFPFFLPAQILAPRGLTPNGQVFQMVSNGDTVYSVGFIRRVGYKTGGAGFIAGQRPDLRFPIINGDVYAMIPDGSNGWYIGGSFTQVDTAFRTNLVHILGSGEVDPLFNFPVNGEVRALARSGNDLYIGGKFTQVSNQARTYLASISLFSGASILSNWAPNPDDHVYSLATTSSFLVAGGAFSVIANVQQPALAVFNLGNGQLVQSRTPGTGQVNALAIKGQQLYAGGTFLSEAGYFTGSAAAFSGVQNKPGFGFPRISGTVHTLIPDGSGGWYAAGAIIRVNGQTTGRVVHILANNTLDASFNPSPNNTVFALWRSGDTLFIGGTFTLIAGQNRSNLAAYRLSTNTLLAWAPNPDAKVGTLTGNGVHVFAGGTFERVSGMYQPRFAAIRRSNASVTPSVAPVSGEVNSLALSPTSGAQLILGGDFNGSVGIPAARAAILSASGLSSSPKLPNFGGSVDAAIPDGSGGWYVGGAFFQVNGVTQQRLAHILADTTLDAAFNFSVNGGVNALARSGNTLYLGGSFTSVNAVTRNYLAAIDLNTKTLLPWDPNANGAVSALLEEGGTVYAGGVFTSLGGQTRNRAGAINGTTGAVTAWNPDASQEVATLVASASHIYLGGSFTTLGGSTFNRLARVDKTTGAPDAGWNPNAGGTVNALVLNGTASVFAGGSFLSIGGQSRNRLAEVSLAAGAAVTAFNPGMNNAVNALAFMGGNLYAGGAFTQVGAAAQSRLAGFNPATGALLAWNPAPNNTVNCIATAGTRLLIGGSFEALQAETRTRLAYLNAATLALQTWAPNLNGEVQTLLIHQNELIATGRFTQADGQTRNRIARWNLGNLALSAWNPNADDDVNAVSAQGDTVWFAGDFLNLSGASRTRMGAVTFTSGALTPWNPGTHAVARTIAKSGNTVVTGGEFSTVSNQTRNRLLCLDVLADTLTGWAPDLPGIFFGPRVNALAVSGDSVWIGGAFGSISGISRQNMALTDGITGQVLSPLAETNGEVLSLHVNGNDLWIGGSFMGTVNGVPRENVAIVDRSSGTVNPYDPSADDRVYVVNSNNLVVAMGGQFEQLGSVDRNGGYAIVGSTGELLPWDPGLGINAQISSIALDPIGRHAYISGFFSDVHGQSRHNLARVSLDTGLPDSWQVDAGIGITQLLWEPVSKTLYIGGDYFSIGGQTNKPYLSAVDAAGNVLPFNPAPDGRIGALAWHKGKLYVGGNFSTIAGQTRNRIAAVDASGQLLPWAPQVTTLSGSPGQIDAIEIGYDRIYIGGFFQQVDGETRYRLAAFDLQTEALLPWVSPVDPLSGTALKRVSTIREEGNNLFLLGAMENVNGTQVNGFAWVDPLSGLVKGMRILPGGSVFTLAVTDSLLHLGGDFNTIDRKNRFFTADFSFPANFFKVGFTGVVPARGGNRGDLTTTIFGNGLQPGLKVILRKTGFSDIVAFDSLTYVLSGLQARTTFNLRNALPGLRDLLLISGADTTLIVDGFEVQDGGASDVWATAILPADMRVPATGRVLTYPVVVNFGNDGNIDAEGVPIWVAIDTTLDVVDLEFQWIPLTQGIGNPADSGVTSAIVDTVFNTAFGSRIYVMILPRIGAGEQGSIVFRVSGTRVGTAKVMAWATDPFYGSPLKYAVGECADLIIGKLIGVVPGGGCVYNALDALLSPIFDAAYDTKNFGTVQWTASWSLTLANAIVDCGILATGGGLALDIISDVLKLPNTINDLNTILQSCIPQLPQPIPHPTQTQVRGAFDPNQKSGPGGAGPQRWVSQTTHFPYLIEFENVETATAPALIVEVADTLDTQVYDLSSFQFSFFTIADSVFALPRGRSRWTSWVDLRPRINSLVKVDLALEGNVVRAVFDSYDPLTIQPQSGVNDGFLPPNLNNMEGMGSVAFSVDRLPGLPTLTQLENRAAIYFDGNAPIVTNTWLNTLDVDPPVSNVNPLDTLQTTTAIPLHWTSSDFGSDIWYYQLWVSDNSGPFRLALDYFKDTTLVFPGEWGHTYGFYTLAIDSAGNAEAKPDTADATTRVAGGLAVEPESGLHFELYPNPTQGAFTLEIDAQFAQTATWRVTDLAGRVVLERQFDLQPGENQVRMSMQSAKGIYIGTLETEEGTVRRRFVVGE